MTNPYKKLQDMFAPGAAEVVGQVIGVTGQVLTVRTNTGVVEAYSLNGVAYRVGDEVLVRGNVAKRKVAPSSAVPVYFV